MYDQDFVNKTFESYEKKGMSPNYYSFDIQRTDGRNEGNDFGRPPVRDLVAFSTDFQNEERQDLITRHSIMNRRVNVYVSSMVKVKGKDGKETIEKTEPVECGTFLFNQIDSIWDGFEVFRDHPLALKTLNDICTAYHLKNLFPLQN